MKKMFWAVIAMFIVITSMAVTATAANENAEYNYFINGTEYTVTFADSNADPEKQGLIAQTLVGLCDGNVQTYNLACTLTGHLLDYTATSLIKHKYRSYQPRCLNEEYKVEFCTRCEYRNPTLASSRYIYCCPDD